ncbi:glycosyltransferase family 2 protein [Streptomyces microflavus]|uniref:glycosyltransferase family 2 protein n=1 Tax=Streptomyces microflavus TaxID=1919 RepID=UPI0037FCDF3F
MCPGRFTGGPDTATGRSAVISVVIPTLNRLGPLRRALRSVSRQTYRDFEVVVVNDGGTSPRHVVEEWRGEMNIALFDLEAPQGVSHARNVGVLSARGEYVAFLDDDDIFLPCHLERAYQDLSAHDADAVYGEALVGDRWMEALPRVAEHTPLKNFEFDARYLLVANFIHTGSLVVRNFADTPARFTEKLAHCEDWDMWMTLQEELGYRFRFSGACTSVYHQVALDNSTVQGAYQQSPTEFTRARAWLYTKWATDDPLIQEYRAWFREFDRRLDARIAAASPLPEHAFDRALRATHEPFRKGEQPDLAWLDPVFTT